MAEVEKTQDQTWDEVGEQFDAMGKSLAAAVDETAGDEQLKQDLKNTQAEYQATVSQIVQKTKAAKGSGEEPNLDEEANKLGELSAKLGREATAAGTGAVQAAQPHLSGALESTQAGLNQIIDGLKKRPS